MKSRWFVIYRDNKDKEIKREGYFFRRSARMARYRSVILADDVIKEITRLMPTARIPEGQIFSAEVERAPESKYRQYLRYVLRHKRFVYKEGRKLGVGRWQLLKHDWSKFLPGEWRPYADYFYGDDRNSEETLLRFNEAWLKHIHRNKHHWQYWVLAFDEGGTAALEMPEKYRNEMLADWKGAGAALNMPNTAAWYMEGYQGMQFHTETRAWIEDQLGVHT